MSFAYATQRVHLSQGLPPISEQSGVRHPPLPKRPESTASNEPSRPRSRAHRAPDGSVQHIETCKRAAAKRWAKDPAEKAKAAPAEADLSEGPLCPDGCGVAMRSAGSRRGRRRWRCPTCKTRATGEVLAGTSQDRKREAARAGALARWEKVRAVRREQVSGGAPVGAEE